MEESLISYQSQIVDSVTKPEEVPDKVPQSDWTMIREWIRSKRSIHTKRAYQYNINLFYEFIKSASLKDVTLTDLQDYAEHLLELHPEPATQAQILATVKSVLTFGQKMGYLQFNVGTALLLPQGKEKLAERMLEQGQLYKMLDIASQKPDKRNYTLLMVLYGSGIRCSELCGLQWKDVKENRDSGQITVLGKRNKTRSIPLHTKVWQVLQSYKPATAKPDDYVFKSRQGAKGIKGKLTEARIWQIVSGIAKEAGIDKVSPHWLRHTHATRALEHSAPIKLLQETLGHASLAVTGRYTHVRPEDSSSKYLEF